MFLQKMSLKNLDPQEILAKKLEKILKNYLKTNQVGWSL
jgi:hypothetical protein